MSTTTSTTADLRAALAALRREARHGVLATGRYRMRYFTWGSGPPLVFIHGMADTAAAFVMVMYRLADRFTCVGYELPDGTTDGSQLGRYTHPDYVADLLALLDQLGLARAAALGSSFGSTITITALTAAPGRFTHAILQGGFARRPLRWFQTWLANVARFWPGWFGSWPGIYAAVKAVIERPTYTAVPREVRDYWLGEGGRTPIRAAAVRSAMIGRTDLRRLLPSIRVPVLLIGGDRDPLVPRECERELEEGIPDVRRVEIAACGHYPQYTHPGPMAAAMRAFLG